MFQKDKLKTVSSVGNEIVVRTNWFEYDVGGHNLIRISRPFNANEKGVVSMNFYSGFTREERISEVLNVKWLESDSLVVINTVLNNNLKKVDSLYWLEPKQ
ncbi:MAG: hypothetical protein Aureis2KO_07840 [Aureisphaera sp.]